MEKTMVQLMRRLRIVKNTNGFSIISGITTLTTVDTKKQAETIAQAIIDTNNKCDNRHCLFTM